MKIFKKYFRKTKGANILDFISSNNDSERVIGEAEIESRLDFSDHKKFRLNLD